MIIPLTGEIIMLSTVGKPKKLVDRYPCIMKSKHDDMYILVPSDYKGSMSCVVTVIHTNAATTSITVGDVINALMSDYIRTRDPIT